MYIRSSLSFMLVKILTHIYANHIDYVVYKIKSCHFVIATEYIIAVLTSSALKGT